MPEFEIPIRLTIEYALVLHVDDLDSDHATSTAARILETLTVGTEGDDGAVHALDGELDISDHYVGEPIAVGGLDVEEDASGAEVTKARREATGAGPGQPGRPLGSTSARRTRYVTDFSQLSPEPWAGRRRTP